MGYVIGDVLPLVRTPQVDRMRIAYMAVAMRDPNPVHVEDDYAVRSGLPSVIAHGTFVVSYLAAAVTRVAGVDGLRDFQIDLSAPVFAGDQLTAEAEVTAVEPAGNDTLVRVRLSAAKPDGTVVGRGTATFSV